MTYETPEIIEMGEADQLIQFWPNLTNIENDPITSRNWQKPGTCQSTAE